MSSRVIAFLVAAGCALILGVTLSACSGNKSSVPPTAPGSVPTAPAGLTSSAMSMAEGSVTLTWNPSPNASSYVVEVGRTPGASDVTTRTTAMTTFKVEGLPAGQQLHVRVYAVSDAGRSAQGAELTVFLPDLRDYIEALFLGSGAYTVRSGVPQCPRPRGSGTPGIWAGFPRGSNVRVLLPDSVTAANRAAVETTTAALSDLTRGAVQGRVEMIGEVNPEPSTDEMSMALAPELIRDCSIRGCCSQTSPGCILWFFRAPGVLDSSKALLSLEAYPTILMHEMGHGLFGMCHIDAASIGGGTNSLMSEGQNIVSQTGLSTFDKEATRAVYGSGLNPGATRDQFRAAGLIR